MGIKPEDILPDDKDTTEMNGVIVRKATVAAALANAEILSSKTASIAEKNAARKMILALADSLIALKLHEHLTWKNDDIQKMIDDKLKGR